ncbi:MAG: LLM class F420-dependent oxidoreductase [Gammaproteobacteria bacterium]|nr:LLM class F420-dependent oxidoreductase [Gammaproteobacteria bacterium]
MKIGFFCVGIGPSARPEVIDLIARSTEACGYYSLWAPEHIVLLDKYASSYPYTQNGRMPFEDLTVDFLDPYLALTFAAAVTKKIRLGTGISLVPERQPLTLAKEVATLDLLSNGRFDFGVGIGWMKEEFDALQVSWPRRAERTRDYLAAMQAAWTQASSSHAGEFCRFEGVRSYPKPVQKPHPPIIFGGESAPALKRVGEIGDGWWGVNVTPDSAKAHIATIRAHAEAAGRDPSRLFFSATIGMGVPTTPDDLKRFEDVGVHQVIIGAFAASAEEYQRLIEDNARALIA